MQVFSLMYAIKCFRVMACLGFQLVGGYIKSQALPFSCQFFQNSFVRESFLHNQTRFLFAHGDYYIATVYIHYVFFPSLQFNSRKIALYCLMLKATYFSWFLVLGFLLLLVLLLLLLLILLLLLEGACAVTPLPTNRAEIKGVGKSKTK